MSKIKIQIFHKNAAKSVIKLIRTVWVEKDSAKKLTGKKAGQILANNFPDLSKSGNRNGLIKTEKGWWTTRTIKPTEKCNYHYIWEEAFVTEED